ncbi:MAG: O-antigen ligase family protein [Planctomycetes bacterium]|nr:O-antigen ligase family protein [Planctomycetota bacterium]
MHNRLQTALAPFLLAAAVLAGLALLGERGLVLAAAALGGLILAIVTWRHEEAILLAGLACLIGFPFFLGFSRTPKIFADEVLLLVLPAVVVVRVLLGAEPLRLPASGLFWPVLFLLVLALPMVRTPPGLVAARDFAETFGLGVPLCLVAAQTAREGTGTRAAVVLAVMVILVAVAGIAETVFLYNPLMDHIAAVSGDEYVYLSPAIAAATGASYRPYVVFFHPSEGATVVALCLPFVVALLGGGRHRLLSGAALTAGMAFVVVNATRGAWFALAMTACLFLAGCRRLLVAAVPLGLILALLAPAVFGESAFWDRVADFRNLRIRFWYWDLALRHAETAPALGIGYGRFAEDYLTIDPAIPAAIARDVENVATVDNSPLMILTEQGLVGLAGFAGLFLVLAFHLRRARRAAARDPAAAPFVQAALASLCVYLLCGLLADVHLFHKATKLVCLLVGIGWGLGLRQAEREGRLP